MMSKDTKDIQLAMSTTPEEDARIKGLNDAAEVEQLHRMAVNQNAELNRVARERFRR
jgi:hypothetical protein